MFKMDYTYPDFQKFRKNINAEGNINYLDATKFSQLIYSYAAREETCIENLRTAEGIMLGFRLLQSDRGSIREGLVACGIPAGIFKDNKKKSKYSMDADRIAAAFDYLEKTPNLRDAAMNAYNYLVWHSEKSLLSTTLSRTRGAMSSGMIQKAENVYGWDNLQLLEIGNVYNQRVTGRFYPKNLSITSLPLAVRQCIVAPKNAFLAAFDFRQIDFEVMYNLFLRGYNAEEDKVYDSEPEDKYFAMYKIICKRGRVIMLEDAYKNNRQDIKTAILAAGYGGQFNTLFNTYRDSDFCRALVDYYVQHEGYQEVVGKIVILMELGISFRVRDYFGFGLDIPVKEVIPNVGEFDLSEEQIIKYAISYIVQSTSNSIYTKWVNYVMDEFEKVGCADNIMVSLSVFDEAVLSMDMTSLQHFYILRNAQRISIADWGPIRLKPEIYIHYKDREYTYDGEGECVAAIEKEIEDVCERNSDKIISDFKTGERRTAKMIPTLHTIYLMSTSSPKEILKDYFGLLHTDYDYMFDIEAVNKVQQLAEQTGLTSLSRYAELYDRFVLVNGESGKKFRYCGVNSLPNILDKYDIAYVNVNVVIGEGFTTLGPACGNKSSLQPSMVVEELTNGDWSIS